MPIKDLIENCKTEMGPKVFEQFRLDVAGEKVASGKPMVPCWCNGTGFTDNVDRGAVCDGASRQNMPAL